MSIILIPTRDQPILSSLGEELLNQPDLETERLIVDAVGSLETNVSSFTISNNLPISQFNAKAVLLSSLVRNHINSDFLSVFLKLITKVNELNSNEHLHTLSNIYLTLESNQQKSNFIETLLGLKEIDIFSHKSNPLLKIVKDYLSIAEDQIKPQLIAKILELVFLTADLQNNNLGFIKDILSKNGLKSKLLAFNSEVALMIARLEFHYLSPNTDINLIISIFKKSESNYSQQISILEKIQSNNFKSLLANESNSSLAHQIKLAQAITAVKILHSLGSSVTFNLVKEQLNVSILL